MTQLLPPPENEPEAPPPPIVDEPVVIPNDIFYADNVQGNVYLYSIKVFILIFLLKFQRSHQNTILKLYMLLPMRKKKILK